jgi:hypothetical protein
MDMKQSLPENSSQIPQRKYTWPWFVLAALLLGIALAILWMSFEVRRTRRNRDLSSPRSGNQAQKVVAQRGNADRRYYADSNSPT